MTRSLNRVLVPVDVSETNPLEETLLQSMPVGELVLLGYWPIPDQSTSQQHRDQFGTEAEDRLQTIADRLARDESELQSELVFTKDSANLIDAATNEYDCQSVLIPGTEPPSSGTPQGIVLIKPDADLDRIVETLGELFAESDVELHLFHVAESENRHLYDATEYMLRGLVTRLTELGIDRDRVTWEQSTDRGRLDAILPQIPEFDFVVLSETKPSVRARIFGTVQSTLADETEKPLLTIRTGK